MWERGKFGGEEKKKGKGENGEWDGWVCVGMVCVHMCLGMLRNTSHPEGSVEVGLG